MTKIQNKIDEVEINFTLHYFPSCCQCILSDVAMFLLQRNIGMVTSVDEIKCNLKLFEYNKIISNAQSETFNHIHNKLDNIMNKNV